MEGVRGGVSCVGCAAFSLSFANLFHVHGAVFAALSLIAGRRMRRCALLLCRS